VFLGDCRVEHKQQGDQRDGGEYHQKLELKGIPWVSPMSIPNTAGTSPDPVGNNTDTRDS
jgi:hypothetical protein